MPEPPIQLEVLNHIARTTRDLEASRRFYLDVLGCREISRPAFNFRGAWLYVAGLQFHLIEDPATPDSPASINTRESHIAFRVADLDAMELRLQAHKIPYKRSAIQDRKIDQIFFRDPDGWMIEIGRDYWAIDN
jgi:catechol 2,3-dioxygenase-like lactoylglutathione lyase family enzyme